MKIKYKKIVLTLAVFLSAPLMSLAYNSQCTIRIGLGSRVRINDVMSCIEERYGYDTNIMRRANRKVNAPAAEVYFDNTSPKEGEKVTATAVPKFFKNSNENLYYTWFIIHDENGDGKPDNTLEEGKSEAMGIVARGNYDPELFAAKYGSGVDDHDEYDAPIGGLDGYGAKSGSRIDEFESEIMTTKQTVDTDHITRCYRRLFGMQFGAGGDFDTGDNLIIRCRHEFPDEGMYAGSGCSGYEVGDGEFTSGEEECWGLDPENPDTDGDGIDDEADVAGLNQQQFTFYYKERDRVGVIIEGMSMITTPEDGKSGSDFASGQNPAGIEVNSYYKLFWGSIGICTKDDKDYLGGDGCDDNDDIGFNYWAVKPVEEEGPRNLETDLIKEPDNPQVDTEDDAYTDLVTINSVIKNESADSEYAYYEWEIYKCDPDDLERCSSGTDLLTGCSEGEQIKDCASNYFSAGGLAEGMAVNKIDFKPKASLMDEEKVYLKVFLKTRRYKGDARFSLSSIMVPLVKNDFKIKFYKVIPDGDGFGFGEEICTEGVYRDVCPVYPFQIIGAKASYSGSLGGDVTYYWEINEKPISPLLACQMYDEGCTLKDKVYFPVLGDNLFLGNVSLLAKRKDQDDLITDRMYSINNPLAVIKIDDLNSTWPLIRADNSESLDVFQTYTGNLVTLKTEMVPDYLEINKDVFLKWYFDGEEVTEDFISNNPELEINTLDNGKKFQYKVLGSTGGINNVAVKVEKIFSFDEKYALSQNWNVLEAENLINESSVSVKIVYPGDDVTMAYNGADSLKMFLASTIHNTPSYLITIVRLAILLVIIWSVLFGFSYLIKPRKII